MSSQSPPQGGVVRQARRYLFEDGNVPPGLVADHLVRSWLRCHQAGLAPTGRIDAPCCSPQQLLPILEDQCELVAHARPTMEYLHGQVRDSGSLVLLADSRGTVLEVLGDQSFVQRAGRVSLAPGASWHEVHRGTNAIGTALAEGLPVEIHGYEHFLERNAFLSCSAAPIQGPAGELLGVLNISGDQRGRHPHTSGLVRTAVQMIENRLLCSRFQRSIRIHFHTSPEGVGTLAEGVLALSEDGWIVGANRAALAHLGMLPADLGATPLARIFDVTMSDILDWGRRRPGLFMSLPGSRGQRYFAQIHAERAPVTVVANQPQAVADSLARLDTGDSRMATAVERARRVLAKPIAVLLAGESGVGKELFAQAMHASGPRREKNFVAVNCAALPENLIEAELFGYLPGAFTGARREGYAGRIREAHGGTLFLDEIGDMPVALQARLLRVLQERQVVSLGGGKPSTVDFALICATHRDLRQEIDAGRFRADLYYRINGLTLILPPLREREDFSALVRRVLLAESGGRSLYLDPAVEDAFAKHDWPGNLRQLVNVLRTAAALADENDDCIGWECLPDDLCNELRSKRRTPPGEVPGGKLRELSDALILDTVQAVAGNMSEAARRLGISRNTLYRRLGWIRNERRGAA